MISICITYQSQIEIFNFKNESRYLIQINIIMNCILLNSPQKGTKGHGTSIFMKPSRSKVMGQKKKMRAKFRPHFLKLLSRFSDRFS